MCVIGHLRHRYLFIIPVLFDICYVRFQTFTKVEHTCACVDDRDNDQYESNDGKDGEWSTNGLVHISFGWLIHSDELE